MRRLKIIGAVLILFGLIAYSSMAWGPPAGWSVFAQALNSGLYSAKLTSSTVKGTTGGVIRQTAEATGTPSGSTTYFDIAVDVPSGARLLGCQLRVDTALTAGETWSAAYITGSTTAIVTTGQAVAKNTKINTLHVDEITTGTTKVRITRDSGNFTDSVGVIRAIVYYESLTVMSSL